MRSTVGRGELLAWLNEFVQAGYAKVEACADGVGYCQVLDALHPGCLTMTRVRFFPRSAEDRAHNIRLMTDALQRLQLEKKVNADKLSKGVFQDNLNFLQWLHAYAGQNPPELPYEGYARRLEFAEEMAPHLIPNEEFLRGGPQQRYEEQLESYIVSLERDLRVRMESNYRLMGMLEKFVTQRNLEYSILRRIEKELAGSRTPVARQLLALIAEVPPDFHPQA